MRWFTSPVIMAIGDHSYYDGDCLSITGEYVRHILPQLGAIDTSIRATMINIDTSKKLPTAADNRVRTIAMRIWRRVA